MRHRFKSLSAIFSSLFLFDNPAFVRLRSSENRQTPLNRTATIYTRISSLVVLFNRKSWRNYRRRLLFRHRPRHAPLHPCRLPPRRVFLAPAQPSSSFSALLNDRVSRRQNRTKSSVTINARWRRKMREEKGRKTRRRPRERNRRFWGGSSRRDKWRTYVESEPYSLELASSEVSTSKI